jgi:hypothetical protein
MPLERFSRPSYIIKSAAKTKEVEVMTANKKPSLKDKVLELQLRRLRQQQGILKKGNDYVPSKSRIKYSGKVTVGTADQNLRGVPGNSRNKYTSMVQEIAAAGTGTRTRKEGIGVLRSARNANTTQGNYNPTIVREAGGRVVSDAQGRKVFGR